MAGAIMDKVWGLFGGVDQGETEEYDDDDAYEYEDKSANYENNEEKIIAHFKTQVDSAELNGFFFEKGISLNHLVKRKQSLEEQFLTLTNSTETQSWNVY